MQLKEVCPFDQGLIFFVDGSGKIVNHYLLDIDEGWGSAYREYFSKEDLHIAQLKHIREVDGKPMSVQPSGPRSPRGSFSSITSRMCGAPSQRLHLPLLWGLPYDSCPFCHHPLGNVKAKWPKYRAVIHLYYYEDYSAKECAGVLGISETAMQTRLQRGREKLKIMLEREEKQYGSSGL